MGTDTDTSIGTFPAIPVSDELAALYERVENCDTTNTVYGDLSVENDHISRKWSCGILKLFEEGLSSQWLGCWI